MTDVVLFHHAQGLTPGVLAFADRLREAGHTVWTPDLYEGATFESLDAGIAHADAIGFGTVLDRGRAAAESLPAEVVYAGFSLGVLPAQLLTQTRAGAKGALLCHSCLPVAEVGSPWPGVPAQIHAMADDRLFTHEGDLEAAQALTESAEEVTLFLYPGGEHLFADSSLPSYDEGAATLLTQRVLQFLDGIG